jgi:O-glycosyl hydrolase
MLSAARNPFAFILLSGAIGIALPQSAVVTVDPSVTYQTIEGMGLCGVSGWKTRSGPFYVDVPFERVADTLVNYVGVTMLRGFDTRACEFCPGDRQYVITADIRAELLRARALADAAAAAVEVFRYSPNVFSPPGWMKQNGVCEGGEESTYQTNPANSLLPQNYAAYAAMCSAYVRVAADSFGVPLYAFSPQNEPFFNEVYPSCSYSGGAHYAQMLAVVGPAVKRASPATLIYGVEHMAWAYPAWEAAVLNNAGASPYLDRFAVHGLTDGIHADTTTFDTLPDTHARPLWLSEYNYGQQTHADAFVYILSAVKALVRGGISAYMAGGQLWDAVGTKYVGYYLNAQLLRFVRPGMTRVGAVSSDTSLLVGVFRDERIGAISVVLFNTGTSDLSVTLTGPPGALPVEFGEVRTTSATQSFVQSGPVAGTGTVVVAAQSAVSMGQGHHGGGSNATHRPASMATRSVPAAGGRGCVVDLRGRPLSASARAAGVYVVRGDAKSPTCHHVCVQVVAGRALR